MIPFILFYIVRLIYSVIVGFIQARDFDSDNKNSYSFKGNKSMIYLKRKNFLMWMIPVFGWIWLLIYQIKKGFKRFKIL